MREIIEKIIFVVENTSFIRIQARIPVKIGLVYIKVIASDSGRYFIP